MKKVKKWVHFIAICGTGMGGMAVVMKKMGWKVTGSDIDIYPPISSYLSNNKINIQNAFKLSHVKKDIDLIVLGGSALIDDRNNPEYIRAKELGLRIVGYGQLAAKYIVKNNSIVVTGTYGKTTITSMLAWVMSDLGEDVSYLIGGQPVNFNEIAHVGSSEYSIVEGDEYPSIIYFDFKPRFMYYKPKFVILTSAKWDHLDVFPEEKNYVERYISLVKLIPKDGVLVASKDGENLDAVLRYAKCKVIRYSEKDFKDSLSVIGRHNIENAAAVLKLLNELGFPEDKIYKSLAGFRGVKKRLEVVYADSKTTLISDFAQHRDKLKASIDSVDDRYQKEKFIVVLDPHASIFKKTEALEKFSEVFKKVDYLIVRRLKTLKGHHDVTGPMIVKATGLPKNRAEYIPLDVDIIGKLMEQTRGQKSVILFCSTGGLNGLI